MESGFSVDLGELEELGGKYLELAGDVRDDVSWKFGVDIERWPAEDRLREAVDAYQRGLRSAVVRLCGDAEQVGVSLREAAEHYREVDGTAAGHFASAGEGASTGGDPLGRAAD